MRVFITGIAGFLGSHLADWFLDHGHHVAGCDNLFGGDLENVPKDVEFWHHDILDLNGYAQIIGNADVLYHCAAAAYEGVSVFAPSFISQNIYGGSATTFSAAIQAGVARIVNCSSMARYGRNDVPFRETMLPAPVDPYGIGKYGAECLLTNLADTHGFEYAIAVPHNIYGPRQQYSDPYRNVVSIMINLMLQGRQPIIYGDGSQMRCFSYISDCVGCLAQMAVQDNAVGEVINVGPDEEFITINDLATRIADKLGFDLAPIYKPARPQEVRLATCCAEKAHDRLGYRTTVFLDEGLDCLIEDVRYRGPKPFVYRFDVEYVTSETPTPWTDRLF